MRKGDLITLLLSVLICCFVGELTLRKYTHYPLGLFSNTVSHPNLGHVMDAALPEIDLSGFRNNYVGKPEVVALGDSHTYGFNVRSEESWPSVLGEKLGKHVYNYGVGGYGVLHYDYLMQDAVHLRPEMILVALYLPNDLADVCTLALASPYWFNERDDINIDRKLCIDHQNKKKLANVARSRKSKSWLKENVAIYSVLFDWYAKIRPLKSDEHGLVVGGGETKIKYLKIRKHAENMDMEQPHIKMSLNVLKLFISRAKALVDSSDIDIAVLLIPSKERVYYDQLMTKKTKLPSIYHKLVLNEDMLKAEVSRYMDSLKMPHADVLPSMQKALDSSQSLYSVVDDSHPIGMGYQIYAEKAHELYQEAVDK